MKFAVLGVAFVMLFGTFHMLFIMYDYLYYDSDHGVLNILAEIMNDTLLPEYRASTWAMRNMQYQAFGISRFLFLGVALCCFAVEILKRPRMGE